MHTHTNNVVLVTPRGFPIRPHRALAAHCVRPGNKLRIVVEYGEVIQDEWPTDEAAEEFLSRLTYGMMGVSAVVSDRNVPLNPPFWATRKNAEIAAETVLRAGDTPLHAAQAYAEVLLGMSEQPPHAIDSDHFVRLFDERRAAGRPALILAGMGEPDHSKTDDPITEHSPLARLTILAADIGVHRVVYDRSEVHEIAITTGEDGIGEPPACPRIVFSWCPLNGVFFHEWAGFGGPAICVDQSDGPDEERAAFDPTNAKHVEFLNRLADHFGARGWDDARDRLRAELR